MPEPKKSAKPKSDDSAARLKELTEALQRERADAVNLRRRHESEITSLRTRVKADVVRELLPVIDNFERGLKHIPKDLQGNDYVQGVQAIVKQFEQTLEKMGVTRIRTVGEPFDPELHEAVSHEEGGDGRETVSEELQAGYRLGDEIIRHAMVRVKS